MLRAVVDDDAGNRRRLHALRQGPEYAAPFDEPEPLVSVTLPTRARPDLLMRALRSVLDQTHERLEVLVVGDAAGPEVAETVARAGDPRVHYANLTQRIVAHPDPARHWLVGSTMARNEAARRARGAWLLHFDDDDMLRPDAVSSLLALARESRAEVVYGGFVHHQPQGASASVIEFPPAEGRFGWQGALTHRGLRCFERELVAAHLGLPGDLYLLRRMLRAGVRFAGLDRVVWDYFPSSLWASIASTCPQPSS
jgi:glycosyltransferase involved in cell wall biosynthesis